MSPLSKLKLPGTSSGNQESSKNGFHSIAGTCVPQGPCYKVPLIFPYVVTQEEFGEDLPALIYVLTGLTSMVIQAVLACIMLGKIQSLGKADSNNYNIQLNMQF